MFELFNTPTNSLILKILTFLYFISSSITTFDKRLIQEKRIDNLPANEPMLPWWINFVYWFHISFTIVLFLLNWKYALLIYLIFFILAVLPVLETVGNILMSPFKLRNKK